jgi:hypothetical protein
VPSISEFENLSREVAELRSMTGSKADAVGIYDPSWGLVSHISRLMLNICGKISLRAHNDKFLSADLNDGNVIRAEWADSADVWETFGFIDNGDGTCSFKAVNGCFLGPRINDDRRVFANANEILEWEKFKVFYMEGNKISIHSCGNGKMLSVDAGGRGDLAAVADHAEKCETFRWYPVHNDSVFLKTIIEVEASVKREMDNLVDRLADEILRRAESRFNQNK